MLTRLLETAANAADAAQSGSNGTDLTQLTNILDWFMIVLLPVVALYLFCAVISGDSNFMWSIRSFLHQNRFQIFLLPIPYIHPYLA